LFLILIFSYLIFFIDIKEIILQKIVPKAFNFFFSKSPERSIKLKKKNLFFLLININRDGKNYILKKKKII